jgi:uncharacterized protein with HEPN domain
MTRRDRERLVDIDVAIAAIESHLRRGDISDGLVFDAVRVRLIEIGEAVKQISPDLLATEKSVPWQSVAGMRDRLAHHYYDTSHAILQRTIDEDIPMLKDSLARLRESVGDVES